MRTVRLKARGWIGVKMFGVIDAKPIKRACTSACNAGKVSAFLSLQRMKCSLWVLLRALFENNVDTLRFWRPNAEIRLVCAEQFRSDWIAAKLSGIGHASFSPTNRGLAVGFNDFSFPLRHWRPRTSRRWLRKQPQIAGKRRENRVLFSLIRCVLRQQIGPASAQNWNTAFMGEDAVIAMKVSILGAKIDEARGNYDRLFYQRVELDLQL